MFHYEHRESHCDVGTLHSLQMHAHLHQHLELVYVLKGTLGIEIGGTPYAVQPGGLAVIFPGVVHAYPGSDFEAQLFMLNTAAVPEFAHELRKKQPLCPCLGAQELHPEVPLLLETIHAEHPQSSERLLKGRLLVLLSHITAALTLTEKPASRGDELLYRLLHYMSLHYGEDMSLDGLAAQLGASRYQVSRCFSNKIGCSFTTYLNTLRLENAAHLLRCTDMPVTEIGYEAGFGSLGTFYRAFTAQYGMPPGRMRQQGQENSRA